MAFMRCSVTSVLKFVVSVVLLVSVVSCRWGPPGIEKLKEYCEKDAELSMGDPVYVNGYFTSGENCNHCPQSIIEDGFDFFEFKVEPQRPARVVYPELGYWRMERMPKASNQCDSRIQRHIEEFKTTDYKRFVKQYCIAAYPIESLRSEYGYSDIMEWEKVVDSKHGSQLRKFRAEVVNIESGAILSRRLTYGLRPFPSSSLSYGKNYYCDKVGVEFDRSKGTSVSSWTLRSN
jgi:hypothetical protein